MIITSVSDCNLIRRAIRDEKSRILSWAAGLYGRWEFPTILPPGFPSGPALAQVGARTLLLSIEVATKATSARTPAVPMHFPARQTCCNSVAGCLHRCGSAASEIRKCRKRRRRSMHYEPISHYTPWLWVSEGFEIIIWTWTRGVSNQIILCRWREMVSHLCEIIVRNINTTNRL